MRRGFAASRLSASPARSIAPPAARNSQVRILVLAQATVKGLMMDFQLTVPAIMRRAEQLFGPKEIVTRLPDRSFHRYTYADFVARAKRLKRVFWRRARSKPPGSEVDVFFSSLFPKK